MCKYPILVLFAAALACVSCLTFAQPKASIPEPPQPAAPAPAAPVIETQTIAQLPSPQPVPPESVPPRPPVEYHPPVAETEAEPEPAPAHSLPKTPRTPKKKENAATPAETTPPAAEVPPVAVPAAPPAEEAPVTPPTLKAADDHSTSKDQVRAVIAEVRKRVRDISLEPQTAATRAAVARINSLVRLAEQSNAHNDLRRADILASRAQALARDLNPQR